MLQKKKRCVCDFVIWDFRNRLRGIWFTEQPWNVCSLKQRRACTFTSITYLLPKDKKSINFYLNHTYVLVCVTAVCCTLTFMNKIRKGSVFWANDVGLKTEPWGTTKNRAFQTSSCSVWHLRVPATASASLSRRSSYYINALNHSIQGCSAKTEHSSTS